MSRIEQAIARKKQQLPQFEYLWRVEMPSLGMVGGDMSLDVSGLAANLGSQALQGRGNSPVRQLGEQTPPVRQLGEQPQQNSGRSGMFGVTPSGAVNALFGALQMGSPSITGANMDEISHRVTSFDAPMPSIESKKNTHGSTFVYTASNNDIGNVTIKIDEMEDGLTLEYLTQWMSMVTRDDGFYNPPAFYKRDLKIIRMTSTELDIHVSTYHGYYPIEISPIGYSYESNGILQYSVTFSGDSVSHNIIPAGQVRSMVDGAQSQIMNGYGTQSGFNISGFSSVIGAAGQIINKRNFNKIIDTVRMVGGFLS